MRSTTFPATQMRKSVLVVEPAVFASVTCTVTMQTSQFPVYQEPVQISHLQAQLVLALLVSSTACLDVNHVADICCSRHPATSLDYILDVTFCPDGSYCCGNNNSACCISNNGYLEIFYRNPGTIPYATALLPEYYSSLRVSTKSRSTTISPSSSSTQSPTTASPSTFSTANTSPTSSPTSTSSTPTSSTPTASPTSASHSNTENDGLSETTKIAIGVVIPVVALVSGFVAWWFLGRRRSYEATRMRNETLERHPTGVRSADSHPIGELPSGLDRAELITKQWDSAELPSRHEASELADRS